MIRFNSRCRLSILMLAVVLGACTTTKPAPQPNPARATAGANDILFRAISLVGTPYRYGGNTPQGGFDCSGLVGYVYLDVAGIALPRSAEDMSRIKSRDVSREELASGDLVFFRDHRRVSHVGIYVGENRFVHAPNEGGMVRLDQLDAPYWREHYSGAKRVLN
jgi:cell wall-associated NlpC family hydrolase